MFGARFYNETMRRYVAVFGSLFNDIVIERRDNGGALIQQMKVPISYAPMQKILARLEGDPNLDSQAISLPRMSFEITGLTYDPERRLSTRATAKSQVNPEDRTQVVSNFVPTPYNLDVQLNVMTKYSEDGSKILEQILPYFSPDFTPSVKILDGIDESWDIPIVLTGVSSEDSYENNFEERRALIWTLNFTMKVYFFGPTTNRKIIKFVDARVYTTMDQNDDPAERITVQPGLTANGEPTTDINETIDYLDINFEDDWDYIVRIENE